MELFLENLKITDSQEIIYESPLKSPLRYPGGKTRVAKLFSNYIPVHKKYREIFAGGAALFFHKPKSEVNWINDNHSGLYAFYTALRDNFESFVKLCLQQKGDLKNIFSYWVNRRDLMNAHGNESILERAIQFYFINRTVWGGRVVYDYNRKSRLYFSNPEGWNNIDKKIEHLTKISKKLKNVKITCKSFDECLNNLTKDTFIYCDPPYIRDTNCHPTDKLYDKTFSEKHHNLLAKLLQNIPAKVMISYDNCPRAHELYNTGKWRFIELEWKYCGRYAMTKENKINGIKEKKVSGKELLILNY